MKYLKNVVTLKYFPEKCTGCARCVEVCPHGVFEMKDKRAILLDRDSCMECGACKKNCAFGAIEVSEGVGCASAILGALRSGGEPVCNCS
jgi:NAD-dependent dihydropyrimidine dehydrogenase PreA subunit